MSSTQDKKNNSKCTCATGKGKDLIVITIETCCRRDCASAPKAKITQGPGSPKSVKAVHSSPELTPLPSEEGKTGDGDAQKEPKSDKPIVTQYSKDEVRVDNTKHRLYKLPVLGERHHGPGCAMEISVLEKHESSCMYKKEEGEGRHVDDKVGSYDCIGRLVFKTCNPTELGTDSGMTGPTKFIAATIPPPAPPTITGPKTPQKETPRQPSVATTIPPPAPPTVTSPKTPQNETPRQSSVTSSPSLSYRSGTSKMNSPGVSERGSVNSPAASVEEPVSPEKREPVEGAKKNRWKRKEHTTMTAAILEDPNELEGEKETKHFRGDGCKLHGPRKPLFLSTTQIRKATSSKKIFPTYADGGIQTDPVSEDERNLKGKVSEETISTLNSVPKSGKKKTSFWGYLFKRGSHNSSNPTERQKRKRGK